MCIKSFDINSWLAFPTSMWTSFALRCSLVSECRLLSPSHGHSIWLFQNHRPTIIVVPINSEASQNSPMAFVILVFYCRGTRNPGEVSLTMLEMYTRT
ncbi:uncharacterized protein Dsimw501_GD27198 [Drosophila simulans]|uniref:Uncharacterized protein n=1 Tax=Drosophila simulans TaxID=7240 RepID=A0A0J9R4S2_DROSI|nr:uncharacterized protein Dsimw501_GD27198 [Drosophila simulans]